MRQHGNSQRLGKSEKRFQIQHTIARVVNNDIQGTAVSRLGRGVCRRPYRCGVRCGGGTAPIRIGLRRLRGWRAGCVRRSGWAFSGTRLQTWPDSDFRFRGSDIRTLAAPRIRRRAHRTRVFRALRRAPRNGKSNGKQKDADNGQGSNGPACPRTACRRRGRSRPRGPTPRRSASICTTGVLRRSSFAL